MGGSATLLVTLKGDQRGSLSDTTDTKVNQLQHHIQSIQELCSGLNNPIQELLSTVELQGNLRLKRVAETSSSPSLENSGTWRIRPASLGQLLRQRACRENVRKTVHAKRRTHRR